MTIALHVAAGLLVLTGIAHSWLGERYILVRLFRRDNLPRLFGDDTFTRHTLRFAWHLTTLAWWGLAAVLVLMTESSVSAVALAWVVALTAAGSGLLALVCSRGRHLSWLVFFVVAGVALWAALDSSRALPVQVVERYMAAYNDHDVDAMLELVHPDVQWLSIDGDRIQVETDGAEALAEALRGYFEAVPSTRSSIESMMVSGKRVSVRERAHWESSGQPRSQAALSVYEIVDGRIVRVWYFPAE